MRRLISIIIAIFFAFTTFGQSILKDGIHIVPVECGDAVILPYYVVEGGEIKFGFYQNASDGAISIKPQFDDIWNGKYSLFPVKKNGKWGVVDASAKWYHSKTDLAIPCKYDEIRVLDNKTVMAIINGKVEKITL